MLGVGKREQGALAMAEQSQLGERVDIGESRASETQARGPELRERVRAHVERVNATPLSRPEQIKRFEVLAAQFTTEGGELTSTLEIRRAEVLKKYADVVEALYA